ncbi:hypothetical protein CU097_011586 [Rhizopus azygosporus]|uniref:Uncharacterized protein n=1 Tax=Rhizopus azygosporus TaxID=86630 RepID=A0A367K6Q1_RHIAZ|nr:hypothetical protein CU097_011586 [Rhizopus azygosporus]
MFRDNGVTVNLPLPTGDIVLFFRGMMDSNPVNCIANSFIIAYNVTSKSYGNFTTKMNAPTCAIKEGASAILDSKTNIIYFFGGKNIGKHSQPGYSSFTAGCANLIFSPGSIALNVSDVTNIQLLNQYSPNIANTTTEQQPDASATTTSGSILPPKSLTVGAKAGIAIGVIIGTAAIFGVAFLSYRKRAKRLAQSAYQAQKKEAIKHPDALDWDKIENEHLELKRPPALNQPRPTSSLIRLTPDVDPNSTYTVHKAEDISQTPDVRL